MFATIQTPILFITAIMVAGVLAVDYKTPTLFDIAKMNDPLLNEIFYESSIELRQRSARPGEPPLLTSSMRPPDPQNSRYTGEIPINRPAAFNQRFEPPPSNQIGAPDGLNELAAASGKLAGAGAQAFAQGAQQVGRAFGFQPQAQNDFFNQAARFFG